MYDIPPRNIRVIVKYADNKRTIRKIQIIPPVPIKGSKDVKTEHIVKTMDFEKLIVKATWGIDQEGKFYLEDVGLELAKLPELPSRSQGIIRKAYFIEGLVAGFTINWKGEYENITLRPERNPFAGY